MLATDSYPDSDDGISVIKLAELMSPQYRNSCNIMSLTSIAASSEVIILDLRMRN